jgi:hypothetical protein
MEIILSLIVYSFAFDCRHKWCKSVFSTFRSHQQCGTIMCWEAEIFVEDRKAVDPLVSLDGTSKGRIDSDVCSVCNY